MEIHLLPCVLHSKIQGRCPKDGGVEKTQQGERIGLQSPLPCRVLWHYGELQNIIGRKGYFSILSPCVSVREYRGSARRARGLERWHIVFLQYYSLCHYVPLCLYFTWQNARGEGRAFHFMVWHFFVQKGNSLRFPTEPIFSLIIDLACNSKKTEK